MSSTRGKLITLLNNHSKDFISGEKLSHMLNISRSAVWKHMNELKKDGYTIEGVPRLGYRIIDTPDKISENTITWGLETTWMGKTILDKDTTETTQKDAQTEIGRASCREREKNKVGDAAGKTTKRETETRV